MTTLTTPPKTVSHRDEGLLNANISASASSLTVGPIYKWVNGVKTKQGFDSASGLIEISQGDRYERASFSSSSVDATTKITTLSGLTRGISVTSTTPTFGAGTGLSWDKGSRVAVVVDEAYLQDAAYQSAANTFTATQTITAPLVVSGSTSYVKVPSLTTAQRTALSSINGMLVYDTDLGQLFKGEGAAWAAVATGSFSNAANGTAGKVDLATAAEVAAGTANDATSGAANVIPVSIVKTSSSGAVNGTVPALNSAVSLDVTIGGTGRTSVTSGALLVGAGTSAMTVIGPGSANQIPLSNGTTIAMSNLKYYSQVVYLGYSDSGTLSNPTSETTLDTHNYAISANDLINGVAYEYEAVFSYAWGAGTLQIDTCFGTTSLLGGVPSLGTPGGAGIAYQKGTIWGTAAAGASVAVRTVAYSGFNNAATNRCDYASTNVATNGSLTLQWRALFGASNGTNSIKLVAVTIKKISTTQF